MCGCTFSLPFSVSHLFRRGGAPIPDDNEPIGWARLNCEEMRICTEAYPFPLFERDLTGEELLVPCTTATAEELQRALPKGSSPPGPGTPGVTWPCPQPRVFFNVGKKVRVRTALPSSFRRWAYESRDPGGRRAIFRSISAIAVLKDELNPSRGFMVPSRVFSVEQTLQW